MRGKKNWLLGLLVLSMLLAACGPDMATPTPKPEDGGESQATAPVGESEEPTARPVVELPVDPDDWHALGEPDAPVTMVEYSDFQ